MTMKSLKPELYIGGSRRLQLQFETWLIHQNLTSERGTYECKVRKYHVYQCTVTFQLELRKKCFATLN